MIFRKTVLVLNGLAFSACGALEVSASFVRRCHKIYCREDGFGVSAVTRQAVGLATKARESSCESVRTFVLSLPTNLTAMFVHSSLRSRMLLYSDLR